MSTQQGTAASRQKGTGSIRERSPGHYELRVYVPATKRQVVRTYVAPRAEKGAGIRAARAELAKLVAEVAQGKHDGNEAKAEGDGATLSYLLDQWLAQCASLGRSPTTLHGYKAKAGRIKCARIASKAVAKLTTRDVDLFYAQLRAEGMTPATLIHHHRVLRAALNQAERWGWIVRNPAKYATVASSAAPELHIPTPEQAQALVLRAATTLSPDLAPVLLFLMLTGLRRGEACGLQWRDLDWSGGRVTVRRSVWQVRSDWGVKDPKTHQVRPVALDENALGLLRARREAAEADAAAAGVALADDAYIWSTRADGSVPRTPNSLTRAFHRLCRVVEAETKAAGKSGYYRYRLHDLRHFSATELIGAGVDPRTVAGRLGHADPSVTLRVYAHALEERDRDAAELLGRRLGLPSARREGAPQHPA